MVLKQRILSFLILASVLIGASGNSTETCDRRCLANALVAKELLSAPQSDNCSIQVNITSIQYETLSFNTKDMQLTSRIKVNMEWKDPDLGWSQEKYRFPTITLPVDKIWTPGLVMDNAIDTSVEPYTNDVQVRRDGTVDHAVILFTTVSCEINLFNYPFVSGECPVAINGWSQKSCGLTFHIADNVSLVGASRGEWQTVNVVKAVDGIQTDRSYLLVTLSINPFSAFVTLILPSALILLADLVSFALPFEGGERNSFKVTLVLSFTMFLLILNDHLPNGGNCSPLLQYHFSFCLICLVMTLLTSLVLTRLSVDSSILPCKRSKVHLSMNTKAPNDSPDQEKETETGVIGSTNSGELASLQRIVNILENMDKGEKETESNSAFVYRLDKICFFFFLSIYMIYAIIIISITRTDICKVNNLDFWDDSNTADYNYDYSY